ncbi:hypothetical protein BVX93_00450, partial [bacterium B13(2017)]
MKHLRSPNGCPWDLEQTHESLIKYLREESFEVIEAIYSKDDNLFCEELGDLILQVVFHAIIAKERGAFGIKDILNSINEKLLNRHPHVFDENHIQEDTLENQWEKIKKSEKKCYKDIDVNLDPFLDAERIQLMAAKDS